MTNDHLHHFTRKDLAEMARQNGILRWYALRKNELLRALTPLVKPPTAQPQPQRAAARTAASPPVEKPAESPKLHSGPPTRDLATHAPHDYGKDRVVTLVRDPYWLHCYWEISRKAVQRAEAALGQDWYNSRPILRLLDVSSRDTTMTSEAIVRDIEIHGGCNNWYIDVANPPRSYRIDIGYLSHRGLFYAMARSNVVTTPRAGKSDAIDENWADLNLLSAERMYAMSGGSALNGGNLELKQLFEERLRRPLGSPAVTCFGAGAYLAGRLKKFWFQVEAELLVQGATDPAARVTLGGEPVKLRPDGTFTVRFSLPEGRQIIPATATSGDGEEERTTVLAIERNTRKLDPMSHQVNGD